jgi:DNA-binding transcriptional MerR regulator
VFPKGALKKIGELAKKAEITVRTLHHYDYIGLLSPSFRSENGFRFYNQDDTIRLQRIQALKQFGCSLKEVRSFLDKQQRSIFDITLMQQKYLAVFLKATIPDSMHR